MIWKFNVDGVGIRGWRAHCWRGRALQKPEAKTESQQSQEKTEIPCEDQSCKQGEQLNLQIIFFFNWSYHVCWGRISSFSLGGRSNKGWVKKYNAKKEKKWLITQFSYLEINEKRNCNNHALKFWFLFPSKLFRNGIEILLLSFNLFLKSSLSL